MSFQQRWPARLWLVRHGESAGNVASHLAVASGELRVDIAQRDVDVPLSERGVAQSLALAKWLSTLAEDERPDVMLTSPYLRARQTAELLLKESGLADRVRPAQCDERLREREFGILDRLTESGVRQMHPEQAEFRRVIGKFYHRPPGGESWCDVILRLRGALDTMSLHHGGRRVLILTHQVVVLCMRYLLENLTEDAILAIDRQGDVANCAVTEYRFEPSLGPHGGLVLERYNFVTPLEEAGAPVTSEPDLNVAAR